MAIIKYIPKKREIKDNRSEDGGYYEASCEKCGSLFFPKRSLAKYCSRSCQVMAYRDTIAQKKLVPTIKKDKQLALPPENVVNGKKELIMAIKGHIKHGDTLYIKDSLSVLEIGDKFKYSNISIVRISANKYGYIYV